MKKAQLTTKVIKVIIIALISMVIVLFLLKRIGLTAQDVAKREICKQSVKKHALANIQGLNLIDDIDCVTEYETITATSNNKIKRELANRMYWCWDMFGQGKLLLFDAASETFCVVCYVVDFKKKTTIDDFLSYLADNNPPGHKESYYEFLTGYKVTPELEEKIAKLQNYSIETNNTYAVTFVYAKKDLLSKIERAGLGVAVGAAVTAITGIILIATGVGAPAGLLMLASAGAMAGGAIHGYKTGGPAAEWQASSFLIPYEAPQLKDLGCTELKGAVAPEEEQKPFI